MQRREKRVNSLPNSLPVVRGPNEPYTLDWIETMRPAQAQGWIWNDDGVLRKFATGQAVDTPWRHSTVRIPGAKRDCKYLQMIFELVLKNVRAVPKFCMECYKVVVYPRHLGDVAKIETWQQDGDSKQYACKVGADKRGYTRSPWGAYWYCRGPVEGRERLEYVTRWVRKNLGDDVEVFLKRGCTEYENEMPESDKWEYHEFAERLENEAEELIDPGPILQGQPDVIAHRIHKEWLAWARSVDRPTVRCRVRVGACQGRVDSHPRGHGSCCQGQRGAGAGRSSGAARRVSAEIRQMR
jgi:hypothetical protein